jgi:hypothetical protein
MEIKKIKVFSYEELSDSSKERARAKFLEGADFPWWSDSESSIRAFVDYFGVGDLDFSIGAFCPSYITAKAQNSHFKGLKLKHFKELATKECKTGYCVEADLWQNFADEWERTSSPLLAFQSALDKACWSIQSDMEYHQSDEYAAETIELNEYLFTEDGDFANYKFTEEAA